MSADAGHSVHPAYAHLHDPAVQPLINHGPLLKINAQQRYATDAAGAAIWARACAAAGQPLELRMQPGYDHSYYFIATFIGEHIGWHARILRAGKDDSGKV